MRNRTYASSEKSAPAAGRSRYRLLSQPPVGGLFRLALLACVLGLGASLPLAAQITSTIQGYISDPAGASIPIAAVTATHEETGVARTVNSAEDGYFRIPDLLVGVYRLRVEAAGFKSVSRSGIQVTARTVVGQNFSLELGEVSESITVSVEGVQVETQDARINDTISEDLLRSMPLQGRTAVSAVLTSPGITGKFESFGGTYCCDVFGVLRSPDFSSGGNEFKTNYTVDGLSMRFTDGPQWGMSFQPNPDALAEVNVSVSPYSAEQGSVSGPQVQMITKGGTNALHGTAHYTFQQDDLNAVPFRSSRDAVPDAHYRLFGGTLGGPIIRDRLFGFFAYEGRRAKRASSSVELAETEAFKNWVVSTRPNSIAAQLLQDYQPVKYPTEGLVDLNGDGVADLGEVVVDTPVTQGGRQFNGRTDFHFPGGKDRIYGSYWYTRPTESGTALRPAFAQNFLTAVNYVNVAHSRSFSPNTLNEIRFGVSDTSTDIRHQGDYHIPGISTDDGLSLGNFAWSQDIWQTKIVEFGDTLSINRGRHGFKIGGGYTMRELSFQSLLPADNPAYYFGSIFDFADDSPYQEERAVNVATGEANVTDQTHQQRELNLYFQNTWQVRPNLTLNYGLRWENYFRVRLKSDKPTWQSVSPQDALSASTLGQLINRPVDDYFDSDLNNFGPRIAVAWDPTGQGKMSVRANFGIIYDEINALHLYNTGANPPGTAVVSAGEDFGVPIVYGIAPVGTRQFPLNPNLETPVLTPEGSFEGARPDLASFATDMTNPMVYDGFVGVQYQLFREVMVFGNYRYRRTTNDVYADDLNRFEGDMLDGFVDRINPFFNAINYQTNWGRRIYHGLVLGASKRFSAGFSIDAHYTYNNAKNNFGSVGQFADSSGTRPFDPDFDYARDDNAHVFTFRNVWELPILRGRSGLAARILGGWQLNSMWNLQTGPLFTPVSSRRFRDGGDFNADGRNNDRPDTPTGNLPGSFSKEQWLQGSTLSADIFPLPDPANPRPGNLPRDYFRRPGYARIDVAMAKLFRIKERIDAQFRAEAFNALNRVNIRSVNSTLNSSQFAQVTGAYQMRTIQFSLKLTF